VNGAGFRPPRASVRSRGCRRSQTRTDVDVQPRDGHEWAIKANGAPWCRTTGRLAHGCGVCNGTRRGRGASHDLVRQRALASRGARGRERKLVKPERQERLLQGEVPSRHGAGAHGTTGRLWRGAPGRVRDVARYLTGCGTAAGFPPPARWQPGARTPARRALDPGTGRRCCGARAAPCLALSRGLGVRPSARTWPPPHLPSPRPRAFPPPPTKRPTHDVLACFQNELHALASGSNRNRGGAFIYADRGAAAPQVDRPTVRSTCGGAQVR
jgi:hypothetical protein